MKITLPDKSVKEFPKGTTPKQVAESIGKRLAQDALVAVVAGKLVDLNFSIEHDCSLKILTFADPEGVHVFRHSTAHVLAHAIQELYPAAKNTIGPAVEEGFYYDFDDLPISADDFSKIEEKMLEIIKKALPTKREVWSLAQVKERLGKKNAYKTELASEFAKSGNELSVYWQGDSFVDLCEGPHIPNTSMIGAVKLTKLAGAYWRGDNKNKQLTRIYG
ncbi:MAG: TGS domain-containing protein, partial [Candidatus Woesearchaeota archaeon]|nr:TGS domain-containing protein [Candidatus Woesearchaeota archaeon]